MVRHDHVPLILSRTSRCRFQTSKHNATTSVSVRLVRFPQHTDTLTHPKKRDKYTYREAPYHRSMCFGLAGLSFMVRRRGRWNRYHKTIFTSPAWPPAATPWTSPGITPHWNKSDFTQDREIIYPITNNVNFLSRAKIGFILFF